MVRVALARNCLRTGHEGDLAKQWLLMELNRTDSSDRARLYAALSIVEYAQQELQAEVVTVLNSGSCLLRRWGKLLQEFGTFSQIPMDALRNEFANEIALVKVGLEDWPDHLYEVRDAFESLVVAAILTPDGRLRRNLIEAVVGAGLVGPAVRTFSKIYRSMDDPGLTEPALFLLSRLRQPEPEVIDALTEAALGGDTQIAQTALWGLGDLYNSQSEQLYSHGAIDALFKAIEMPSSDEAAVAAAHALAVIAKGWSNPDIRNRLANLPGVAVLEVPSRDVRQAMCWWGVQMHDARGSDVFVDPTALGLRGLLPSCTRVARLLVAVLDRMQALRRPASA